MRIYSAVFLVIYAYNTLSDIADISESYCFQYTWIGPRMKQKPNNTNIPWIEPILSSDTKPNTTELWENWKNEKMKRRNILDTTELIENWKNHEETEQRNISDYFCTMKSDDVCIRYTYIYNNAIVNISCFCGKMIEDQTKAVTSDCYTQHIEGYTIEAYACQSRNSSVYKPCNTAIQNTYSILNTMSVAAAPLFMYKMFSLF